MRSPIRYIGRKSMLAPRIVELLPDHTHYVEPFAGSLAVLLAKPPSRYETVNDINDDLITFWLVLRDRPDELERACKMTPHSRSEYRLAFSAEAPVDDVERARRVWVKLTQGFSPRISIVSGWACTVTPSNAPFPKQLRTTVGLLSAAVDRLQQVSIECTDALTLIGRLGKYESTCIYADPPYHAESRGVTVQRHQAYSHEMLGEDSHRDLARALNECNASAVVSGYRTPLYDEIYEGWERHDFKARPVRIGDTHEDRVRTESVWVKSSAAEPRTGTDGLF